MSFTWSRSPCSDMVAHTQSQDASVGLRLLLVLGMPFQNALAAEDREQSHAALYDTIRKPAA